MTITPEQFTLEHMDKLVRGLGVARERMAKLEAALKEEKERNEDLFTDNERYQRNAKDAAMWEESFASLSEMVLDMDRGLVAPEELVEWLRQANAA